MISSGANKTEIYKITSGAIGASPIITFDKTVTTAVKGMVKTGVTVTLTQLKNDPELSEFLQTYASEASGQTPEEVYLEDGQKETSGSGDMPELLVVLYGSVDSTSARRKVYTFCAEISGASGDETFEFNKFAKRSIELKAVKWIGTSDITLDDAIFDDTLVDVTDLTNALHATWKLPDKVVTQTYGTEWWVKAV